MAFEEEAKSGANGISMVEGVFEFGNRVRSAAARKTGFPLAAVDVPSARTAAM